MDLFDTHCHLNFKAFSGGEGKIIARAAAVGVSRIVVPGTDIVTSEKAIEIAAAHPGVWAAVGIHPHHVTGYTQLPGADGAITSDLAKIGALASHERVVAIGEIGLDRHSYRESRYGPDIHISDENVQLQERILRAQLEIAIKYNLPVILHNREAQDDILRVLSDYTSWLRGRAVFHCCEAQKSLLDFALAHDLFIGIDGDVTYESQKKDFVKSVPLDRVLLETDAPYLLPEPLRTAKKYPNLPANIPLIAAEVARLKGESIENVAKKTTENAMRLFIEDSF